MNSYQPAPGTIGGREQPSVGHRNQQKLLIRGGVVITMDQAVPDQLYGEVSILDGEIEAVRPGKSAYRDLTNAQVLDVEEGILIPGLQDTHRHCWQTQLRRMFAAVDLAHYVDVAHSRLAPQYSPEDIYWATLLADLGAIDGGVTAILDFAHNSRSAEHTDAALQAHSDAGIRAVLAVAPPLSGSWDRQWPADLGRVAGLASPLVSIAYGVFGTSELGGDEIALTAENVRVARDMGLPVVVDATFGPSASRNIERLGDSGLLGPDITLIHCTALTQRAWDQIQDSGVRVSLTTTSDAEIGIYDANPPILESMRRGIRPGLSVDVECSLSGDFFAQMRATYTIQRMQAFALANASKPAPEPMLPREVLAMATIGGAVVNGLSAVSGSITPGKRADLVVVSTDGVSTMPMNNAVSSIVLGSDSAAVKHVIIDGNLLKLDGELVGVDLDGLRRQVADSRDRLLAASGYSPDPLR